MEDEQEENWQWGQYAHGSSNLLKFGSKADLSFHLKVAIQTAIWVAAEKRRIMTCRVESLPVLVILNIWQGVRVVLQDKTMRKRLVLTFNLLKKNSHLLGVSSILGTTNNHQCSFPRTYHLTDFL